MSARIIFELWQGCRKFGGAIRKGLCMLKIKNCSQKFGFAPPSSFSKSLSGMRFQQHNVLICSIIIRGQHSLASTLKARIEPEYEAKGNIDTWDRDGHGKVCGKSS